MLSLSDAIDGWANAVAWLDEADEEAELIADLVWRDNVADALARGERPTDAQREKLRGLDDQFIRARPGLVERCPGVFTGAERGATEDEWWWWPDKEPRPTARIS